MRYKLRSGLGRVTEPLELAPSSPSSTEPCVGPKGEGQHQGDKVGGGGQPGNNPSASTSSTNTLSNTSESNLKPPSCKRRKLHRRKRKPEILALNHDNVSIYSLPQELILLFVENLDLQSALAFLRTCKHFHSMLHGCESYWRIMCHKAEFCVTSCLEHLPDQQDGFAGKPMYLNREEEEGYGTWSTIWRRGIQLRKNITTSNYKGWRLFCNSACPIVQLAPDLDMNLVKQKLGDFPRLSHNDDLKLDWDDKYLVVFHFLRGETETCKIRLWDIEDKPRFLYEVDKGTECITDKVFIHTGYVVIVPSWPLETQALVMTLDINDNMKEKGRYLFPNEETQLALDNHWDHTQLRVVCGHALVTCRAPDWRLLVTSLPDCQVKRQIDLTVSHLYECSQIRSYKGTAVILFHHKAKQEESCLVTVDITPSGGAEIRSTHYTWGVTDVAVYTDPEEIYAVLRDGSLDMYDANNRKMTRKIHDPFGGHNGGGGASGSQRPASLQSSSNSSVENCEFQLFVNGKEQIYIVQSAPEAASGRSVRVFNHQGEPQYSVNLDLAKYGLSRDESVCVYTHAAFLLVADSKKFVMFDVKKGNFMGIMNIPCHLERSKGKEDKDCMYEQSSLGMFVFDENRLLAVHDYERNFPAVIDIYSFW